MHKHLTLIVFQHGLWGNSSHMSFLHKKLTAALGDRDDISMLNVTVNESKYTYDGVDICGQRLADTIQAHVKKLRTEDKIVTRCILVGYSLGGLMLRYAIGVLGQQGFFEDIEPTLFVTFATPHLGVRRPPVSTFAKVYNFLSGTLVSRSGEQLQLTDDYENGRPLLAVLADPDQVFYRYLSKFKTRRTYANIANDRTVPYWTAAMDSVNYFHALDDLEITVDSEYPSIVTAFDVQTDKNSRSPRFSRKRFTRYVIYVIYPILIPLAVVLALSFIGTQGVVSRYRCSKLLTQHAHRLQLRHEESVSQAERMADDAVAETIDISVPNGDTDADMKPKQVVDSTERDNVSLTFESTATRSALHNVRPSPRLAELRPPLKLDPRQLEMKKHLDGLHWERILVYIDGFNAHGSIVCRQPRFTNDGGKAVVQHFVDSLNI